MTTVGPPQQESADAPRQDTGAVTERIEHPFSNTAPVNEPIAWGDNEPAEPVPFDWASVERACDGESTDQLQVDYAKKYQGISCYLRDMSEAAPQPGRLPTLKESACNWMASCYVLQLPFVAGKSLRECAASAGVSHEYFRRFVQHWAAELRLPVPFAKAPETGEKIAVQLRGRKRGKVKAP